MSHFNGDQFVKKLKELQIPGSSDLNGSDYDWMFLNDKNGALPQFWSWFSQNITEEDVLSDDQLREYDELVKSDSALTIKQIEEMDGLLGINPVLEVSKNQYSVPETSNIYNIETEIESLKRRQNFMNIETLSLQEEINGLDQSIKNLESSVQKETSECLGNESALKNIKKELGSILQNISSQLSMPKNSNGPYLHQVSIDDWIANEEFQTKSLQEFVDKQFNQEMSDMGENQDSGTYELIDTENIELHMVKGPTYEEYKSNALELKRLHRSITLSELDLIETKLEGVKLRAETSSTMEFVKKLREKKVPLNLSVLKNEVNSLEISGDVSSKCLEKKKLETQDLARAVSLMERSKTIAGNYTAKLQRQKYFLNKQNYVLDQILLKWARCELLYAICQKESQETDDLLAPMIKITEYLREKNSRAKERLKIVHENLPENDSKETDVFDTKKAELIENQQLIKKIQELQTAQAKTKEDTMNHLHRLGDFERTFERCLMGQHKNSKTIPHTWLNPSLVARTSHLEESHWKCMKEVIAINEDYETKKKILEVNENVAKEQFSWMSKFC